MVGLLEIREDKKEQNMKFLPKTNQIIVAGISLMGLAVTAGWMTATIDSSDALVVVTMIVAGFLSLLKGVE